jgi:hypothetical protein
LAGDFSMMGEELITTFPPWYENGIPDKTRPLRSLHDHPAEPCPQEQCH